MLFGQKQAVLHAQLSMKELILSTRDVWPEAGSEVRR